MSRLVCAASLALLLSGCGDNLLGGSLSEIFPLDVSRVEVYRNEEALQITYYFNRNVFLDVVVRVSVYIADQTIKPDARLDLAGEYAPGHPRTVVAHAPGGEPVRLLPRVHKGDLHIISGGDPGVVTRGDFSMVFENEGGDIGFGRTLTGGFSAQTVDAGFGELP